MFKKTIYHYLHNSITQEVAFMMAEKEESARSISENLMQSQTSPVETVL